VLHAIVSDIHSNLEALVAVLDAAHAEGADSIVCLGDVVGYGADPIDVVSLVRESSSVTVKGNHDHAAVQPGAEAGMNDWARAAALWTREHMGEGEASFLSGLPFVGELSGALLVHASPEDPGSWRYILDSSDASRVFPAFSEVICLVGHSHTPAFFQQTDGGARAIAGDVLEIEMGCRYIVNVGSVGQPRDGDPRACFGLFDPEGRVLRIVRVDYDAALARDKIIAVGLPRELGDRLLEGH
jgi:diadenosine tetraphosphatase ApaH/serine/threonine PP2A family protein phosphatase